MSHSIFRGSITRRQFGVRAIAATATMVALLGVSPAVLARPRSTRKP